MRPTTDDDGRPGPGREPSPLSHRLAWFAVLWLASLAATAAVSYGLRALLFL